MTSVIRTDASILIGSGHVMRCLTLAEGLSGLGERVIFVCREHPGNLIERIESAGYQILTLPYDESMVADRYPDEYARWLVVDQKIDAVETLAALDGEGIETDRLIVDHYGLDHLWEGHMRPHSSRVMVIDDLANRRHDCDVLLDQNYHEGMAERYKGLVPSHCQLLLGPKYALLRREFVSAPVQRHSDRERPRVFVYFGAVDPTGATLKTISALGRLPEASWAADVVVGGVNPNRNQIMDQASRLEGITVHTEVRDMAAMMSGADFAVGAGGTTTWERCCMGLPTVIVAVADNQIPIAQSVDRFGAALFLGVADSVSIDALHGAIERMAGDIGLRARMSARCRELVDGRGTGRVVKVLTSSQRTERVHV